MRNFRELKVWQKAHELTLNVYRVTAGFNREELYGLTSQMRRAAYSVPANIAEGCGKNSDVEFARYLQIAAGSASELEYFTELTHDLHMLARDDYEKVFTQVTEVKRMLFAFIESLRSKR